ncbi:MAG: hypothetical protein CVV17_11050, partial [Gammaproteobacteria bacterium HGW-Gammaproteobacteria-7]
MSGGSKRAGRPKGSMSKKAWRHVLPALVALAPMPVLGAASSASSRGRQGERAYQRITEGNRYALDLSATDTSAADAGFAVFAVAPEPPDSPVSVDDDGPVMQELLADDGFRSLMTALGSSRISGRSGAIEATLGSFSEGSFAGRPQISGTCRTTSYCSSDGGIYC